MEQPLKRHVVLVNFHADEIERKNSQQARNRNACENVLRDFIGSAISNWQSPIS